MVYILNIALTVQHYKDFTWIDSSENSPQQIESLFFYFSGISILSNLNEVLFVFKCYLHGTLMFERRNDSLLTLDSLGFESILS